MAVEYVPSIPWTFASGPEKSVQFLVALSLHGSKRKALEESGLSDRFVNTLRERDPAFSDAFDAAVDEAADRLEQEARRRAVEGVDRPVFQGGVRVGEVREYSDRLLEVMLKARSAAYADKPVNVDARSATLVIGGGPQFPRGAGLADWIAGLQRAAGEIALPMPGHETNGSASPEA